ncbi:MAG: hypothetical protein Greene041619_1028 [Candidatus Peregrinibacteria bacterium Greene0416_19]|nr:MAG: hypothetical protein Greene041619_1028 [Candidatus Peregrinibacteria bacterium Greene0416_19]
MKNSLHLTAIERKQFDALPEDVREGWEITDETLEAHERPEELKMRVLMLDQEEPAMKLFVEKLQSAGSIKNPSELAEHLGDVPPSTLYTIFFTIGTRAMSELIAAFLTVATSDDDLAGVAFLTAIRHELFLSNAEVSPA